MDLDLRICIHVWEFSVGEHTFKSFHNVLDERAVVHVLDEHFGLMGGSFSMFHFDLLDTGSKDKQDCQ